MKHSDLRQGDVHVSVSVSVIVSVMNLQATCRITACKRECSPSSAEDRGERSSPATTGWCRTFSRCVFACALAPHVEELFAKVSPRSRSSGTPQSALARTPPPPFKRAHRRHSQNPPHTKISCLHAPRLCLHPPMAPRLPPILLPNLTPPKAVPQTTAQSTLPRTASQVQPAQRQQQPHRTPAPTIAGQMHQQQSQQASSQPQYPLASTGADAASLTTRTNTTAAHQCRVARRYTPAVTVPVRPCLPHLSGSCALAVAPVPRQAAFTAEAAIRCVMQMCAMAGWPRSSASRSLRTGSR